MRIPGLDEVVGYYPEITGVHPVVPIFPVMTEEEFTELAESIGTDGLAVAILLTRDGLLLDGRHRLLACYAARVDPRFEAYTGSDPSLYAYKLNKKRRNLSTGQSAAVELDWGVFRTKELAAKQAQRDAGGDRKSVAYKGSLAANSRQAIPPTKRALTAVEAAAAEAGVGENSMQRAKKVKESAPDLFDKIKAGTVSVNDAYKQAKAREAARPAPERPVPAGPELIQLERHTGELVPYAKPKGPATFNQTNENVSWAKWTWNPVTGCLHGCDFCYAREIANLDKMRASYPAKFEPLFHHQRLDAPKNTPVPKSFDARDGRVFVCSMADLFGEWVPQEWIDAVYTSMLAAPDWRYLTLTKFPQRYRRANVPPHLWAGASIDRQNRVKATERAMRDLPVAVRWLSLEPLLEPLTFTDLSIFDWVVIGSQSGTNQPGKGHVPGFAPNVEWVLDIIGQARAAGCAVYLKPNLLGRTDDQMPGMKLCQEIPAERAAASPSLLVRNAR